jgi:hypothetical protein
LNRSVASVVAMSCTWGEVARSSSEAMKNTNRTEITSTNRAPMFSRRSANFTRRCPSTPMATSDRYHPITPASKKPTMNPPIMPSGAHSAVTTASAM